MGSTRRMCCDAGEVPRCWGCDAGSEARRSLGVLGVAAGRLACLFFRNVHEMRTKSAGMLLATGSRLCCRRPGMSTDSTTRRLPKVHRMP